MDPSLSMRVEGLAHAAPPEPADLAGDEAVGEVDDEQAKDGMEEPGRDQEVVDSVEEGRNEHAPQGQPNAFRRAPRRDPDVKHGPPPEGAVRPSGPHGPDQRSF